MAEPQGPQLYLITPPVLDLASFPGLLARVLDGAPVACLRLALATQDEDTLIRAADALRTEAHARDVPIVIERHALLAARLGLDGVHLPDGARSLRTARKELGGDAILGAFCGRTRHEGLNAAEAGADYVSFGPLRAGQLGDGSAAELALFQWWSEMIEVPVVAEGGLDLASVEALAPFTDFFAFGAEIWGQDDPLAALRALTAPLKA